MLNTDESSMAVDGKNWWIHVVCDTMFTSYYLHPKRGYDAVEAVNILPNFLGHLFHDHWKSHFRLKAIQCLCNAHHLRELRGMYENYDQHWALEMRELLIEINETKQARLK